MGSIIRDSHRQGTPTVAHPPHNVGKASSKKKAKKASSSKKRERSQRKRRKKPEDNQDEAEVVHSDRYEVFADDAGLPPSMMKTATFKGRAPVDEQSGLVGTHHVLEHQGTLYDCVLSQANVAKNRNKFCVIQALQSDKDPRELRLFTKWGCVGESGHIKLEPVASLDSAIDSFVSRFKSKTGNEWIQRENKGANPGKYTWLEQDYVQYVHEADEASDSGRNGALRHKSLRPSNNGKDTASSATSPTKTARPAGIPSKLPPAVYSLGELIFSEKLFSDAVVEMNYDASKLPLGKINKNTIERGYSRLTEIDTILGEPDIRHRELEILTSQFYSLIPRVFGRNHTPPVINTRAMVQRETVMVDNLCHMAAGMQLIHKSGDQKSGQTTNPVDAFIANLKLEAIEPVPKDSAEYKALERYFYDTKGRMHSFRFTIQEIFRVERVGDKERFGPFENLKPNNRQLLWYGSRTTNYAGILSQGLCIAPPEAPAAGTMFGKGIYLTDMSSKSVQYCHAYATKNQALLLLAEAQLGLELKLFNADYQADVRVRHEGKHSTHGIGQIGFKESQWEDASIVLGRQDLRNVKIPQGNPIIEAGNYALLYHEKIVYHEEQIRLRYLFQLDMS